MTEHHSPISGVACSSDGYVATAGYDNQIILWRNRQPVARAFHDHLANQCCFSHDGKLLVTASSDYTARLWSVPELRLLAVMGDHGDDVEMAAFSPDGKWIATASRDHCVRVFDLNGRLQRSFTGHTADVISVAWASDSRELLSSSDDGTLRHWRFFEGDMRCLVDMGGVETDTVAIGQDGTIFAGTDRGEIHVLAGANRQIVAAHEAGIKRLTLSPDGSLLASASYDRTLRIWRRDDDGLVLLRHIAAPVEAWVRSIAFDSAGNLIVGTFGSSYAYYDLKEDRWDLDAVQPTEGINSVLFHDGDTYTVGDAGLVRRNGEALTAIGSLCNFLIAWKDRIVTGGHLGNLFDARTGEILLRYRSPLNCAVALEGGELMIGTYTGDGLRVGQEPGTGRVELRQVILLHDQAIKGIAANRKQVFSVSAAGDAAYHDLSSGDLVRRISKAHRKIANGACVLSNGDFASISRDLRVRIWRGEQVREIESPHDHSIKCVALSSNGRWLGTGSYNGHVSLYDLERDCWGPTYRPTFSGISSLAAGACGDSLMAASYDGKVYLLHADAHESFECLSSLAQA